MTMPKTFVGYDKFCNVLHSYRGVDFYEFYQADPKNKNIVSNKYQFLESEVFYYEIEEVLNIIDEVHLINMILCPMPYFPN